MFLVQFKRLRRGVPEVIRTLHFPAVDGAAALACAQSLAGTRHWPVRTDALRVMDDGGRTLLDWTVPAAIAQPSTDSPRAVPAASTADEPRPAPPPAAERPQEIRHRPALAVPPPPLRCGTAGLVRGGWSARHLERRIRDRQAR